MAALHWGSGGINSSREDGILSHWGLTKKEKKNPLLAFQYVTLQGIKWLIVIPNTHFQSRCLSPEGSDYCQICTAWSREALFWDLIYERYHPLPLQGTSRNIAHSISISVSSKQAHHLPMNSLHLSLAFLSWLDWTWQFSWLFHPVSQIEQELTLA